MQGKYLYQPKSFVCVDIEKLIPAHHILRRINKVFDLSFVQELTASYYCPNNGRPSIAPELFFRMILIGYIFGIKHDRRLCEEIGYNLSYRWYCKLNLDDTVPDHSTISRIKDRYGTELFEHFFSRVLSLCGQAGLVKGERIITDSMLIDADASLDSLAVKEAYKFERTGAIATAHEPLSSNKKFSNQTHVSRTDPDSALAKKSGRQRGLKYKVHTSIDADSRVILDNKLTTGSCHDLPVHLERMNYIQEKYGFIIKESIADKGYGSAKNIQALQKLGITTYIPLFSSNSGKVAQLEQQGFIFDQEKNRYICPQGKSLLPSRREVETVYKSKADDCKNCSIRNDCSASVRKHSPYIRHINRNHHQLFYENERQRMSTPLFIAKMKERMWKIEGINAEAKNLHTLNRARYRGLSKVQIQVYMVGAVQNLKRLLQAITYKNISYFTRYFLRNILYHINLPYNLNINLRSVTQIA